MDIQMDIQRWSPPLANCLKLNVDVTGWLSGMGIGVGAIIRNKRGETVAAKATF